MSSMTNLRRLRPELQANGAEDRSDSEIPSWPAARGPLRVRSDPLIRGDPKGRNRVRRETGKSRWCEAITMKE